MVRVNHVQLLPFRGISAKWAMKNYWCPIEAESVIHLSSQIWWLYSVQCSHILHNNKLFTDSELKFRFLKRHRMSRTEVLEFMLIVWQKHKLHSPARHKVKIEPWPGLTILNHFIFTHT